MTNVSLTPQRHWFSFAGRWLLLVESLLRRRRAEMLENGRVLLDRARHGVDIKQVLRAEVETQLRDSRVLKGIERRGGLTF